MLLTNTLKLPQQIASRCDVITPALLVVLCFICFETSLVSLFMVVIGNKSNQVIVDIKLFDKQFEDCLWE